MQTFSSTSARPLNLSSSTEAQVYSLFALALGLTAIGIAVGFQSMPFLSSPLLLVCVIAELGIILTSSLWMESRPLNYVLFGLFPFLSGFTFTPYITVILENYVNGASILLNAFTSTALMGLAAAVFARTTSLNLSTFGRIFLFALLGLVCFSLLQIFVPVFRLPQVEMLISGFGVVLFAGFTAYDIQRIQQMGRVGANPFLMAISLYLDIFNLFQSILRFMLAVSGQRR